MPKYYSVPYQNILAERESPGSQGRVVSKEGSSEFNIYLWGQVTQNRFLFGLLILFHVLYTEYFRHTLDNNSNLNFSLF